MIIRLTIPDVPKAGSPDAILKRHLAGLRGRGRRVNLIGLLGVLSTEDGDTPLDIEIEADEHSKK